MFIESLAFSDKGRLKTHWKIIEFSVEFIVYLTCIQAKTINIFFLAEFGVYGSSRNIVGSNILCRLDFFAYINYLSLWSLRVLLYIYIRVYVVVYTE